MGAYKYDSDLEVTGKIKANNPIEVTSKSANIDSDYGPYSGKTLDEIATLLSDKMVVGKTVAVYNEDGTVKEYQAQPVSGGGQ